MTSSLLDLLAVLDAQLEQHAAAGRVAGDHRRAGRRVGIAARDQRRPVGRMPSWALLVCRLGAIHSTRAATTNRTATPVAPHLNFSRSRHREFVPISPPDRSVQPSERRRGVTLPLATPMIEKVR